MFDTEPGLPPGVVGGGRTVGQILARTPCCLSPAATLLEVARAVGTLHGEPVVIAERGRPLGVVRAADVVRALLARTDGRSLARGVMSSTVFCLRQDAPLSAAVDLIAVNGAPEVLVIDGSGNCLGVLLPLDVAATLGGGGARDSGPEPAGTKKALA
jgi:CBS domain-containing protein